MRRPIVERAALGSVLVLLAAEVAQVPDVVIGVVALIAALAHAIRLWLWQPWRTLRTPLVWVLHASYAWIVVYLLLRGLAAWDVVPALKTVVDPGARAVVPFTVQTEPSGEGATVTVRVQMTRGMVDEAIRNAMADDEQVDGD